MTNYCSTAINFGNPKVNRSKLKPAAKSTRPLNWEELINLNAQVSAEFYKKAAETKAYAESHPNEVVRIDSRASVNHPCTDLLHSVNEV